MIGEIDCREQQWGWVPKCTWTRNKDFIILDEDSSISSSAFDDEGVDGELWPRCGVHSRAYQWRMPIWKNKIKRS